MWRNRPYEEPSREPPGVPEQRRRQILANFVEKYSKYGVSNVAGQNVSGGRSLGQRRATSPAARARAPLGFSKVLDSNRANFKAGQRFVRGALPELAAGGRAPIVFGRRVAKGHQEFTINAREPANPLTDLLSGFNIVAI
jgi:hypothetical protein